MDDNNQAQTPPAKKAAKRTSAARRASAKRTRIKKSDEALAESKAETVEATLDTDAILEMMQAIEDQTELVQREGKEFQEAWVAVVAEENLIFKRRNKILIRGLAVLVLLSSLLVVGIGYQIYRGLFQTGPLLRDMEIAVAGIQQNQEGIDALVDFVEDLRAEVCDPVRQPDGVCPPTQTEQAVDNLLRVLCASGDPIRIAACQELGLLPD